MAGALTLLLAIGGDAAADSPGLKDPTRPLRTAVRSPEPSRGERPTLESVLIGGGRRLAVIDGRRMAEGEEHHGVKVLQIHADGVVVTVGGSERTTLKITNSRMHKELR